MIPQKIDFNHIYMVTCRGKIGKIFPDRAFPFDTSKEIDCLQFVSRGWSLLGRVPALLAIHRGMGTEASLTDVDEAAFLAAALLGLVPEAD